MLSERPCPKTFYRFLLDCSRRLNVDNASRALATQAFSSLSHLDHPISKHDDDRMIKIMTL